jgi:hypothetical protein
MPKKESTAPRWHDDVEEHNYPAARSYLTLIYPAKTVSTLISKLRSVSASKFMAKDIFRASGLSLLGISNSRITRDRKKIMGGKLLSPILLVRDTTNGRVIVADGYHRLCAVYSFDEEAWIPCKIVS